MCLQLSRRGKTQLAGLVLKPNLKVSFVLEHHEISLITENTAVHVLPTDQVSSPINHKRPQINFRIVSEARTSSATESCCQPEVAHNIVWYHDMRPRQHLSSNLPLVGGFPLLPGQRLFLSQRHIENEGLHPLLQPLLHVHCIMLWRTFSGHSLRCNVQTAAWAGQGRCGLQNRRRNKGREKREQTCTWSSMATA